MAQSRIVVGAVLTFALLGQGLAARQSPVRGQSLLVSGVIVDRAGTPLKGAQVSLDPPGALAVRVLSDERGRFEISLASTSPARLVVRKAGYASAYAQLSNVVSGVATIVMTAGAVLTGTATDSLGRPVQGFIVRVRPLDERSSGTNRPWRQAMTDDQGQYRLGSLPAGRYEVQADGSGVAQSLLSGPSGVVARSLPPTDVDGTGITQRTAIVELEAGTQTIRDYVQSLDDDRDATKEMASLVSTIRNTIGLVRGTPAGRTASATASVSGRIVEPGGLPARLALVQLVDRNTGGLVTASGMDGTYRFEGVPAGSYRVQAQATNFVRPEFETSNDRRSLDVRDNQKLSDVDVTLVKATTVSGVVTDVYGEPLEGLLVAVWREDVRSGRVALSTANIATPAVTDDRGMYRISGVQPGRYYVAVIEPAAETFAPPLTTANATTSLTPASSPVYYPGRPSILDAVPVLANAGADAPGIDIQYSPVPTRRIGGQVVTSSGNPTRADVTLVVSRRSGAPLLPPLAMTTAADGRFEFRRVVAGDYVLQVAEHDPAPDIRVQTVTEFASRFVTVLDEDIDMSIRTSRGSTFSARVELEGPGASNMSSLALNVVPADPDIARPARSMSRQTDGTFQATGIVGSIRVALSSLPTDWWLKSVTIDGLETTDDPFEVGTGKELHDVRVLLSSTPTGVAGRAYDGRGRSLSTGTIVVFPVDPQLATRSRRLHQTAVKDGAFTIQAMPPGDYYVALSVSEVSFNRPEELNLLIPKAKRIMVREGVIENVELTVP